MNKYIPHPHDSISRLINQQTAPATGMNTNKKTIQERITVQEKWQIYSVLFLFCPASRKQQFKANSKIVIIIIIDLCRANGIPTNAFRQNGIGTPEKIAWRRRRRKKTSNRHEVPYLMLTATIVYNASMAQYSNSTKRNHSNCGKTKTKNIVSER